MAGSTIGSANQTTRFQSEVRREYVRGGRFGPYIGKTENAIIQVKQDLKKVSIPLVAKLKSAGVSGSATLGGSEEALANFAATLDPTYWRNGVLIDNEENEKSEFVLFQEARPALMNWGMEKKRDQIIQAMGAIEASGTYANYGGTEGSKGAGAASAANMDTWQAANTDRILYGAVKSNLTSGDHTTSLGTIDTTSDKLDADMVSLLKRIAKQASPLIRPVLIKSDEPWFLFFIGSYSFRDLRADLDTRHQNAAPRSLKDNPLWTGGDLVYDGVIVKEVPEIDIFIDGDGSGSPWDGVWGANAASADGLDNGGDTASRIGIGFLCGAQAVGFGLGRMPSFKRRKEDDYEHLNGVGLSMKHDIKKLFYNAKQHGIVTSFHSAAADS
jgi:hypothetical protein